MEFDMTARSSFSILLSEEMHLPLLTLASRQLGAEVFFFFSICFWPLLKPNMMLKLRL